MEFRKLGSTGMDVSALCLGCMSFGVPSRGNHPWTLGEDDARVIIRRAVDHGVNFFDTANVYSDGTSEEIVGRALADFTQRDEIVVATKVHHRTRSGPNGAGLSRKAIMAEIDNSLGRLGMDHVDLYQIHRFDPATPIVETLEALHDVVKMGKARYIGASSMWAWEFAKMLNTSERNGWTRFVTMQNHYNLLYREEEREMLPMCADQGIGVLPWSPLARGRLARQWDEETVRSRADERGRQLYGDADHSVSEAVGAVAGQRGASRSQVALAWLMGRPGVTAPIVGVTRVGQLDEAVAAVGITLDSEEKKMLEKHYVPHEVLGLTTQTNWV